MDASLTIKDRPQTDGEEIANSISHGIGFIAALVATPLLLTTAWHHGGRAAIIGASLFAGSVALLYFTSTMYHLMPRHRKAKRIFRSMDHMAIFLLIAGTYTPFTLGPLRGTMGWILFGVVWGLALFGIVFKLVKSFRHPVFSTGLYLGMGWLALIAAHSLWVHVPLPGLLWLIGGGVAYTGGVAFYAADDRLHFSHFVWHLFVLTGTTCHFLAVLWYAA